MEARKPTYDDLSALCAQMAAALDAWRPYTGYVSESVYSKHHEALRAYHTASPDPQWQRVPEGFVVVPETITADHIMRASKLMSARVRRKLDSSADAKNAYSAFVRARGEG